MDQSRQPDSASQPATAAAARPVLRLKVLEVKALTDGIRQFRLGAVTGEPLPGFEAGAHVKVQVGLPAGGEHWREYSLISCVPGESAASSSASYVIAVRLEAGGRGGSAWMHQHVQEGDELQVQAPRNDFSLQAHEGCCVLVAGGIGVTPLLSMAVQGVAQGRDVRMVYAARTPELLVYRKELQAVLGDRLQIHTDAGEGRVLDVAALLAACGPQDHLYVCGPKAMLDGILAAARSAGWPDDRIHFELFAAVVPESGDQAFEVVLAQSGRTLTVPADKSLLEALIAEGCDPMYDCMRGECGVCAVPVLEGEIDHRDYVLSAFEKKGGQVIQSCVSRCKGPRLVLDL